MFIASSSDSAGSSDAEYSEGDILESNTKGEVIKEGFLMKKVISVMNHVLLWIIRCNQVFNLHYFSVFVF